jgi:hypothetical protein
VEMTVRIIGLSSKFPIVAEKTGKSGCRDYATKNSVPAGRKD